MKKIFFFIAICFCFNSYCQEASKKAGVYTTICYFMGANGGCNDVWVGVFCKTDNQTLLVASGVAHVGPGCKKSINNNSFCKDAIVREDLIENSNSKEYKYCLTELLKDDEIYSKYEASKNEILSKRKE